MFKRRDDEPEYAILHEVSSPSVNRYGDNIELVDANNELSGKSLNINNDSAIGEYANRYRQHGFYFNADNCIACHACESACSEKNDLPSHLAFRSVGYVEGGTWPSYQRLNISMACNHCDDPVCLKGCPTRAYTKFAEYGAVLQDPDICFGCGYCTWVCPYNAPQLDPVKGQVEKCNMCVDRLEVGLKPACVSACLAGALDFGVTETTPENRNQLNTRIPGFPDPEITHPNIRFQQTRSLPHEMKRPDAMQVSYSRSSHDKASYEPKPDLSSIDNRKAWNFSALSSRENPLVLFTLLSQAAIGAFIFFVISQFFFISNSVAAHVPWLAFAVTATVIILQSIALFLSTVHLGKPLKFYRGFNNLRYSPVSREAALLMVFYIFAGLATLILLAELIFDSSLVPAVMYKGITLLAIVGGVAALYFMHRIYRIKARPFWNHWQVMTDFYGTMLMLGALVAGFILLLALPSSDSGNRNIEWLMVCFIALGGIVKLIGLWCHAHAMKNARNEGAVSYKIQMTKFNYLYWLRVSMLAIGVTLAVMTSAISLTHFETDAIWIAIGILIVASELIGRALFYCLVIPTTMPGAYFWKNQGFAEHAIDTELADFPQTGVVAPRH